MVIRRPAMLPRDALGRTGLEVTLLGFGAEAIGRKGRSFDDAKRTLDAVLDLGVNLIDTASSYGESEAFIGQAISARHKRGEFVLVTKCGWTSEWKPRWEPAELAFTIDESLTKLKMDALDVLLLHSCELEKLQQGDVIEVVKQAREAGKAKFIGYSGDNEALRFAIKSGAFDVIECSFNMLDQANAPMIELASKAGMGVLIKRPIANAVPGATQKPAGDYAAQYWPRWEKLQLKPSDIDDLPWLPTAMRFAGYWPGVNCVLVGSSNADHMRLNTQWLEQGPPPARVAKRLTEAFAQSGKQWPALG